jgi:hypothetical protein
LLEGYSHLCFRCSARAGLHHIRSLRGISVIFMIGAIQLAVSSSQ